MSFRYLISLHYISSSVFQNTFDLYHAAWVISMALLFLFLASRHAIISFPGSSHRIPCVITWRLTAVSDIVHHFDSCHFITGCYGLILVLDFFFSTSHLSSLSSPSFTAQLHLHPLKLIPWLYNSFQLLPWFTSSPQYYFISLLPFMAISWLFYYFKLSFIVFTKFHLSFVLLVHFTPLFYLIFSFKFHCISPHFLYCRLSPAFSSVSFLFMRPWNHHGILIFILFHELLWAFCLALFTFIFTL